MNKIFITIFLIIIFYIGFIAYSDFSDFQINISTVKIEFLVLSCILSFMGLLIAGIRQKILLDKINVKISIKENILLYLSGVGFLVTPGGSGEMIKAYFLKQKYGYKTSKTLPLVIVEKFSDLVAMSVIIGLCIFIIPNIEIFIFWLFFITLVSSAYVILKNKFLFSKLIKIAQRLPIIKKQILTIEESYTEFITMLSKETLFKTSVVSVASWICFSLAIFMVFLSFNLTFDYFYATMVVFSSLIFGAISFLPAGIGITEISLLRFLINAELQESISTALILMIRIVTIWFGTIIGLLCIKKFF